MKTKIILPIILILAFLIATVGCKKDKEETDKKNHLKYDGKTYDLAKGILINYGQWAEIEPNYNFDLLLTSSGIDFEQETGQGHIIYFEFFTSSSSQLAAGTYNYHSSSYNAFTFDYGEFAINGTVDPWSFQYEGEIEGGSVKVEISGSTYTITINGTDSGGNKITGYYKGSLTLYDFSDLKSAGIKPEWKTIFK
jgi:hypothetical protein